MKKMFFKRKKKVIHIEGMTCDHCVKKVEDALEKLADVIKVKIDLKKKLATITYENTLDEIQIQNIIEQLGYTVTGIKDLS